jgi:hypothetical protein
MNKKNNVFPLLPHGSIYPRNLFLRVNTKNLMCFLASSSLYNIPNQKKNVKSSGMEDLANTSIVHP